MGAGPAAPRPIRFYATACVDASLLAVERELDVDGGERSPSQDQAAVEVLLRSSSDREIQDHLLLHGDLAADPIG